MKATNPENNAIFSAFAGFINPFIVSFIIGSVIGFIIGKLKSKR